MLETRCKLKLIFCTVNHFVYVIENDYVIILEHRMLYVAIFMIIEQNVAFGDGWSIFPIYK